MAFSVFKRSGNYKIEPVKPIDSAVKKKPGRKSNDQKKLEEEHLKNLDKNGGNQSSEEKKNTGEPPK